MMQFEIIGANSENYFLIAFDEERDLSKGVFFYKMPVDYFSDYEFKGETVIDILIDVELFIEDMYESLIDNGFLNIISSEEFNEISIDFGGGFSEMFSGQ